MIVVSNSSPLIGLAFISQFGLLEKLYHSIHIPQAVYNEVVTIGAGRPGSREVQNATWITTHPVAPQDSLLIMNTIGIDIGESEAIVLAQTLKADRLILDDIQGRKYAAAQGLKVTGAVGILLLAKQLGHIGKIKPSLDGLRVNNYHLSQSLYQAVLTQAGETL